MNRVLTERFCGKEQAGVILHGSCLSLAEQLRRDWAGKVQCVYIDPPFFTGDLFSMKARVGEADWKRGVGSLKLSAYSDRWDSREAYIENLRAIITLARDLLCDTGLMFLHLDFRMQAHMRLVMDEVFGTENFLNELIWTYQSGGRAKAYFSRKHDVILMYAKTGEYAFYPENVAVPRTDNRRNHMKREVDEDGRVFHTIRSGGKIYRYYDDETVLPGDVWDDVSHLQQKDPQRTGYDTQKPLKLLERIVLCATKENDIVCDLCFGSGTTLEAAIKNGRRFVGTDMSRLAVQVTRNRLLPYAPKAGFTVRMEESAPVPAEIETILGVGFYECWLHAFSLQTDDRAFAGLDGVNSWSVGYLAGDTFTTYATDARSRQHPALKAHLQLPVYDGQPAVRIEDVYGNTCYYPLTVNG